MTIVVTGGSGFIGTSLSKRLLEQGHTVVVAAKIAPLFTHERLFFIKCDLETQPLPYNILEHTDAVINLTGAPIAKKWTQKYKEEIKQSRIQSTRRLVEAIARAQSRPTVFINASAVGFYGDTGDTLIDERAHRGDGFLAEVVDSWEQEALAAEQSGVRVVLVRMAPVLGRGGILQSIMHIARFGFLLRLSKNDFWMPWIHIEDVLSMYQFALETKTLHGPVNAVAPHTVTHHEFIRTLGRVVHRRVFGAIPGWLSRKRFAELFIELTKSQKIAPQLLLDKGFQFTYPELESALKSILMKNK